jgi:hypothetical protein
MIEIRRWPFLAKHIRRMISAERSNVLPLGITGFEPMADLEPAAFAHALIRTAKAFNKPWYYFDHFGLYPSCLHIAVRQRHVEGFCSGLNATG